MPGTTITISGAQRNGLYELVRNHLGSVGDLWDALERDKDFATAARLGLEFGEDFELLRGPRGVPCAFLLSPVAGCAPRAVAMWRRGTTSSPTANGWLAPCANPELIGWRTGFALAEGALGSEEGAAAGRGGGAAGWRAARDRARAACPGNRDSRRAGDRAAARGDRRARRDQGAAGARQIAGRARRGAAARQPLPRGSRATARKPRPRPPLRRDRPGERAHTELTATGARPRKARSSRGVESLTPSELRAARMAAEGMTNREIAQSLFVTAKTVETPPAPRLPEARRGEADRSRRRPLRADLMAQSERRQGTSPS